MNSRPTSYLTNLKVPMPLGRKIWLVFRNGSRRFLGHPCCGHPGEPGC